MAYIVERNGWMYICYPDPANPDKEKRTSLKTRDRDLAEEIAKDYNGAERWDLLGLPEKNKKLNPPLKDLFDEYLEYSKNNKDPRTLRDDKLYIENFLRPSFEHLRTNDLNKKHLEDFVGKLKNWTVKNEQDEEVPAPYHPRTINLRLQCLRAMLNRAVDNGMIYKVPVKVKLLRCPKSLPKYATPDQIAAWLPHIDKPLNRYRAILSLCTSIADSDLGKLRWDKNYVKEFGLITYKRKKTTEDIVITLNAWALETMAALEQFKDGPYIFHGVISTRKAYDNASLNSGVKITSHMLRHSFATWALSDGEDIANIQLIMGHASISTTQIYATVMPLFLAQTTGAIDRMRPPSTLQPSPGKDLSGTIPVQPDKQKEPVSD